MEGVMIEGLESRGRCYPETIFHVPRILSHGIVETHGVQYFSSGIGSEMASLMAAASNTKIPPMISITVSIQYHSMALESIL